MSADRDAAQPTILINRPCPFLESLSIKPTCAGHRQPIKSTFSFYSETNPNTLDILLTLRAKGRSYFIANAPGVSRMSCVSS
jgi:hypothetical protein